MTTRRPTTWSRRSSPNAASNRSVRGRPDAHGEKPLQRQLTRVGRATLALLLGLALAGCASGGGLVVMVQDSSMEPTYRARDLVRFQPVRTVERGAIVAFEYPFTYPGRPRRELIARVIGLPGDSLELGPSGVRVNGAPLAEPYAKNLDRMVEAQVVVPSGSYFVLGDDRDNQRDSRWWGPLRIEKVLGVVSGS